MPHPGVRGYGNGTKRVLDRVLRANFRFSYFGVVQLPVGECADAPISDRFKRSRGFRVYGIFFGQLADRNAKRTIAGDGAGFREPEPRSRHLYGDDNDQRNRRGEFPHHGPSDREREHRCVYLLT